MLIADDDSAFRLALSESLRRRGYRTVVAGSVEEGIREAQAWKPDLATVDLVMPGGGIALVELLRRELPTLKIVVLTGFGSIATAVLAVKAGAIQYLTKPATVAQICAAWDEAGEPEVFHERTNLSLEVLEWEHLQRVLAEAGGNVSEAARRLEMHRRTLQRKLRKRPPGGGNVPG